MDSRHLALVKRCGTALLAASCWSTHASAREASLWRDEWPEFSAVEGALTLGAGVGTLALVIIGPATEPRWRGGVLFDDSVRDAIRADGDRADAHRTVSDVTYYAAPVLPLVVDTFLVAYVLKGDDKLARNLGLISVEAFAYSGFMSFVATQATARERPAVTQCLSDAGGDASQCDLDSRTEGFWSGHTTISATSAGLVCANHFYIPLWGSPVADGLACGIASTAAVTTGVTRLAADQHYATDVIAGSSIGFAIGFAVPTLLHYTAGDRSERAIMAAPVVSSGFTGIAVNGAL